MRGLLCGRYNVSGLDQLNSYVFAINNNPSENADIYPAAVGMSIIPTPIILPYLPDPNKYIIVYTKYDINPGMIFYTITTRIEPEADLVSAEEFVDDGLRKRIGYYAMVECELPPAYNENYVNVDTYGDLQMNADVEQWLNEIDMDLYQDGIYTYTRVVYPDGSTYYRYEGMGPTIINPKHFPTNLELLLIYDSNGFVTSAGTGGVSVWATTPTKISLEPGFIPGLPGPVDVPVLA